MIKFIVNSEENPIYEYYVCCEINGNININDMIYKKFSLECFVGCCWELTLDEKIVTRMPKFDYEDKEAPFKWMIGYLNA